MKKDQEQSKERAQARLQAKMEKKRARKTQERRENSPKKPQKPKKVQADAEEGKTTLQTIFSVVRGVVVIFGVLFLLVWCSSRRGIFCPPC